MRGMGKLSGQAVGLANLRTGAIALIGALLSAGFTAAPAHAATGTAFVRVNQLGYAGPSQAKRAYLMASATETGATFSVKNASGATVFSAPIGTDLGKWSRSYPHVYALDFSQVSTAGTYTVSVSGPIPASSPSFRIDTSTN
ncbi:MAG: cellulase N-terminal Ig-like domain-containing protein, partial [Streptosporangiaceae bacterium]